MADCAIDNRRAYYYGQGFGSQLVLGRVLPVVAQSMTTAAEAAALDAFFAAREHAGVAQAVAAARDIIQDNIAWVSTAQPELLVWLAVAP